jgi:hypothetical protein
MHLVDRIDGEREAVPLPPLPPLPSLASLRQTTAEAVRAAAAGDETALLACLSTPPLAASASARDDPQRNHYATSFPAPPVEWRALESLGFGAPRVDRAFALAAAAQLCEVLTAAADDNDDERRQQSPYPAAAPPDSGHAREVDRAALEAAAALALALIEEGEGGDDAAHAGTATTATATAHASDESFAAGARLADAVLRRASWAQAAEPTTIGRADRASGGGDGAAEEEEQEQEENASARLAHAATASLPLLRALSDAAVGGAWAFRGRTEFLAQLAAAAKLLVHRPLLPVRPLLEDEGSWGADVQRQSRRANPTQSADLEPPMIHPMLPLAEACRRCPELLAEAHATLQLWVVASGGHPQLLRATEAFAGPRMTGVLFPHAMTPLLQLLEQPPTTSPPAAFSAANLLRTQALAAVGGVASGDGGDREEDTARRRRMMRTLVAAAVWMRRPWIDAGLELLYASGRLQWSPAKTTGMAGAAAGTATAATSMQQQPTASMTARQSTALPSPPNNEQSLSLSPLQHAAVEYVAWALWPYDEAAAADDPAEDAAAAEMRRQHTAGKAALVAAAVACPSGDDADAGRSTAWMRQLQRSTSASSSSSFMPTGGARGPHNPPRAMDVEGLTSSAPIGAKREYDDVNAGEPSLASLCPSFAAVHVPLAHASSGPALEKHLGVVLAAVMRGGGEEAISGDGGESEVGEQAEADAEARLLRTAAVVQALDSLLEGPAADSRVSVAPGPTLGSGSALGLSLLRYPALTRANESRGSGADVGGGGRRVRAAGGGHSGDVGRAARRRSEEALQTLAEESRGRCTATPPRNRRPRRCEQQACAGEHGVVTAY